MNYMSTKTYKVYNDQTPTKYQGRSTQHSVIAYMVTGSEDEQIYVWIIDQILYSQTSQHSDQIDSDKKYKLNSKNKHK